MSSQSLYGYVKRTSNDTLLCYIPPELHRNIDTFDGPKIFILISSVMSWALSRPADMSGECVLDLIYV